MFRLVMGMGSPMRCEASLKTTNSPLYQISRNFSYMYMANIAAVIFVICVICMSKISALILPFLKIDNSVILC